jgi:arabinogalactan endo-1,4-beta-galactosidase
LSMRAGVTILVVVAMHFVSTISAAAGYAIGADLHRAVQDTPDHRGAGIFWWEPAVLGPLRSRGFFDDDGHALPVLNVFDRPSAPTLHRGGRPTHRMRRRQAPES